MGSYLSKPRTEIDSSIQENEQFICCTAEMQGWRKTQEDAHVAILNYDDNGTAFFAVFDGHGGHEISKYCAQNLPDFIKKSSFYKEKKISDALEDSFLKFDNTLKEPNVLAELKKLADLNDISDIDDDETSTLRKEASIPIEEIIARNFKIRYGENSNDDDDHDDHKDGKDGEKVQNGNNEENSDEKESSSSSSSSKPLSSLEMAKKNSLLLKSETLKAFLQDYLDEEDDEEDDESDDEEEEEENGESPGDSSSNDDEEDDDEDLDDDDDDDDDDVPDSREDIATGLKNVFNMDYEPGKGSGCTAIVAIVCNDKIYVANAGDSRCVLSRNGQAIQMSEDHKPEDEREKDRIINAGGEITNDGRVNGGLNLSRAIGDHMYKNNPNVSDREQMITALPDILTLPIDKEKDDFLFLACDGIWNSMNSQEVVDFIQKRLKDTDDLKEICSELFKTCLAPSTDGDGSGCDNMTCILVRFKKSNSENSLNNNKNGNIVSIKRPLDDQDSTTTNDQNGTSNDEHHSESLTTNKRIKNDDEKIADNVNDDVYNKPGSSRD
ncbi:Protein phosphatase 1G [Dermatophagoides pteronyssinus]|uniref:protein-serine/threonine phosphatase n=1 Tax=Dermatophagoides pteronyssinus TaxID=6956 RepID=A0ABQ8JI48_DERPT|nr:Protein phosphatase 1G [Dermatophagoides pteronyssinus]